MNADLKQFFKVEDARPGNGCCFECKQPDSSWASVTFGIYLCHNCSGQHRALGSHVSFVRSCLMDTWTPNQLEVMRYVGNKLFEDYLTQNLGADFRKTHRDFSTRYQTQAALKFKAELKQMMNMSSPEGTPRSDYNLNNGNNTAPNMNGIQTPASSTASLQAAVNGVSSAPTPQQNYSNDSVAAGVKKVDIWGKDLWDIWGDDFWGTDDTDLSEILAKQEAEKSQNNVFATNTSSGSTAPSSTQLPSSLNNNASNPVLNAGETTNNSAPSIVTESSHNLPGTNVQSPVTADNIESVNVANMNVVNSLGSNNAQDLLNSNIAASNMVSTNNSSGGDISNAVLISSNGDETNGSSLVVVDEDTNNIPVMKNDGQLEALSPEPELVNPISNTNDVNPLNNQLPMSMDLPTPELVDPAPVAAANPPVANSVDPLFGDNSFSTNTPAVGSTSPVKNDSFAAPLGNGSLNNSVNASMNSGISNTRKESNDFDITSPLSKVSKTSSKNIDDLFGDIGSKPSSKPPSKKTSNVDDLFGDISPSKRSDTAMKKPKMSADDLFGPAPSGISPASTRSNNSKKDPLFGGSTASAAKDALFGGSAASVKTDPLFGDLSSPVKKDPLFGGAAPISPAVKKDDLFGPGPAAKQSAGDDLLDLM